MEGKPGKPKNAGSRDPGEKRDLCTSRKYIVIGKRSHCGRCDNFCASLIVCGGNKFFGPHSRLLGLVGRRRSRIGLEGHFGFPSLIGPLDIYAMV